MKKRRLSAEELEELKRPVRKLLAEIEATALGQLESIKRWSVPEIKVTQDDNDKTLFHFEAKIHYP